MHKEDLYIGSEFDIGKVKLDNVSEDFKKEFIDYYHHSMELINSADDLRKANGLYRLGILRKMSLRMDEYNTTSDFDSSYYNLLRENEPFTET